MLWKHKHSLLFPYTTLVNICPKFDGYFCKKNQEIAKICNFAKVSVILYGSLKHDTMQWQCFKLGIEALIQQQRGFLLKFQIFENVLKFPQCHDYVALCCQAWDFELAKKAKLANTQSSGIKE